MNTPMTPSSTASNPISELIAKVMNKYDTNKDQKLNADEFGSFLSGLLEGTGSVAMKEGGDAEPIELPATAVVPKPFAPTNANWSLMHGFNPTNYYDSGMKSMKYEFARIAADYDPMQPGALDRVAEDPRFKAAFPNAKVVGHDAIDFGGQLSDGAARGVPVFKVDVGELFEQNRSGKAWQWLDVVNG